MVLDHHPAGPLDCLDHWPFARGARRRFLRAARAAGSLPLEKPLSRWGKRPLKLLFEGRRSAGGFKGFLPLVRKALDQLDDADRDYFLEDYGKEVACPDCRGSRLDKRWAAVTVGGRGIGEAAAMTVSGLRRFLTELSVDGKRAVVEPILAEVDSRLEFLELLGLHYLTLDRGAHTLSGGEAQRMRLAAQLGSNLPSPARQRAASADAQAVA